MNTEPSSKKPVRESWSRTALVGLAGVIGLTILGITGILAGQITGSDLVALAGTYAAILGTVAGRAQGGGPGGQ